MSWIYRDWRNMLLFTALSCVIHWICSHICRGRRRFFTWSLVHALVTQFSWCVLQWLP